MADSFSALLNQARAIRRLQAIPAAIQDAVADQLAANAAELVRAQKTFVPVDDEDGGQLRDSIQHFDSSTPSRISQTVKAGGPTTTRAVRAGASATYDYANAQEFGTAKMSPNPFFFPPYRAKRKAFKSALAKAAKGALGAAVRKS